MDRQTKLDVLQKELSRKDYLVNQGLTIYNPVILSDVLVWMKNNQYPFYYIGDKTITMHIPELNKNFYIGRDLTKPYLSEQSDEVINGLYEVYLSLSQPLLTKKD